MMERGAAELSGGEREAELRVYTVHSQKGGVGKTSIALAIAGLAACQGLKSLVVDGDMTGASLEDVPGLSEVGDNSTKRRFNELILAKPLDFLQSTSSMPPKVGDHGSKNFMKHFCRNVSNQEGMFFVSSSTTPSDIQRVLPLISQEDHLLFFRHRMEDILTTAFCAGFQVVVVDHSPGLFGFSRATLQMVLDLSQKRKTHGRLRGLCERISKPESELWSRAVILTSIDPHDHKSLLRSLYYNLVHPHSPEGNDELKEDIQTFVDAFTVIFNKADPSEEAVKAMGRIFTALTTTGSERDLPNSFISMLKNKEKASGAAFCPYIDGFQMSDILSRCRAYVEAERAKLDNRQSLGLWHEWIGNIASRVSLSVRVPV